MINIENLLVYCCVCSFLSFTTQSFAIDKLHFLIGGGAGGGWDGTATGTGEALTKSGMLKSASLKICQEVVEEKLYHF